MMMNSNGEKCHGVNILDARIIALWGLINHAAGCRICRMVGDLLFEIHAQHVILKPGDQALFVLDDRLYHIVD